MVNAPFIQKYTIPKAQWKSLVEATSLWLGEKELMTVVEVSIISVHMDPAPLFSGTAAISKDHLCPGGRDDGPHNSRSPGLSNRKHVQP